MIRRRERSPELWAEMIGLELLGAVELTAFDGRELRSVLTQPKRLALLAYLAVASPRGFDRLRARAEAARRRGQR